MIMWRLKIIFQLLSYAQTGVCMGMYLFVIHKKSLKFTIVFSEIP